MPTVGASVGVADMDIVEAVGVLGCFGGFGKDGSMIVPLRYSVAPFNYTAMLMCLLQATQLVPSNLLSSVYMGGHFQKT